MSTTAPDQSPAPPDGRGSNLSPNRGTSGPRYLYYRMYTPDGAIESKNDVYGNDQYLGRILTRSVAPPHTVASLKRHLRKIEGFPGLGNSDLYPSLASRTALEDSSRVALLDSAGLGSFEREPVAIVIENKDFAVRSGGAANAQTQFGNLDEQELRYVHYRLYDEDGEITTKTSFDETDSSLGRIDVLSVAPPHTVASLNSRVLKAEGVRNKQLKAFLDLGSETPMKNDDHVDFFADSYPGFAEDAPLAIVEAPEAQDAFVEIEDDPDINLDRGFGFLIKAKATHRYADRPALLSITEGEIFQTDGVKILRGPAKKKFYLAMNSAGRMGLVSTYDFGSPFQEGSVGY